MHRKNLQQAQTPFLKKIGLIVFGLFLFFVLLEAALRISGFIMLSLQESRNLKAIKQKGTFRIMCLGESTTALGGINSYPAQLEEILNRSNTRMKFIVVNKGRGSSNTITILRDAEKNIEKYKPDMVIAMMGINDCNAHMPSEDLSFRGSPPFFKTFKVYKLIRLVLLHIKAKFNEFKKPDPVVKSQDAALQNDFSRFDHGKGVSSPYEKDFPSEADLKKEIELKTDDPDGYLKLSHFYYDKGDLLNAESLCRKAIKLKPQDPISYGLLANILESKGKLLEAEAAYKKSIELDPGHCFTYGDLARCLRSQKRYSEAAEAAKKAIAIDPTVHFFWAQLWLIYQDSGKYREAEESIKKFIKTSPLKGMGYNELIILYKQIIADAGQQNYYRYYADKRDRAIEECVQRFTIPNYKKLKEILDDRGIPLVCVQYPTLDIKPLKGIYKGEDNVIFVDNGTVFKGALKDLPYEELFTDRFGVSFGHCTSRGNRILAGNVAKSILKEYFKQADQQ
ncbi:MAG: tetratricopeptide repeat protein [Candidatus Omnitrophica bacterium]|nr:tetratricopeptide repeat protein [Candidatus Omnitrophota bacterium]